MDDNSTVRGIMIIIILINILKYFSFWNRISLDRNYSRLAGTSLTVITEMF